MDSSIIYIVGTIIIIFIVALFVEVAFTIIGAIIGIITSVPLNLIFTI